MTPTTTLPRRLAALLFLATAACGGGTTTNPTPLLQVGGSYATAVALAQDGCGGVQVQAQPTTIAHTAGQPRFTLTHAALVCQGSVSADGSFTTDPLSVPDGGGTATVRIAGRFTTGGFEADATVDLVRATGASCRYVVHWTGTKQGAPNVIP